MDHEDEVAMACPRLTLGAFVLHFLEHPAVDGHELAGAVLLALLDPEIWTPCLPGHPLHLRLCRASIRGLV